MTALYVDASALVKLLIAEPETPAVIELLAEATLFTNEIAAVELACAARRRSLVGSGPRIDAILDVTEVLPLKPEDLASAAATATSPPLRALDAIHLACARRTRRGLAGHLSMVCYGRDLAAASAAEGFEVLAP